MNRGTMLAGALAVMGLAGSAVASVTFVSSNRNIALSTGRGSIEFPGSPSQQAQDSTTAAGVFASSIAEFVPLGTGGNFTAASASQDSFVGTNVFSGSGSVQASAQVTGFWHHEVRSSFSVVFELASDTPIRLEAEVYDMGGFGAPFSSLRLVSWPPGSSEDPIVELESDGSAPSSGIFELVLPAGQYFLNASAYIGLEDQAVGLLDFEFDLGWSFELTFIPAPGSLALLAFGGLAASRRRR